MSLFVNQNGQGVLFGCSGRTDFSRHSSRISVTAENGGFKVNTPYSADFVANLKAQIPATGRKWDNNQKSWLVSREYKEQLKQIIDTAYLCDVVMPTIIAEKAESFETTFQADYVANCKADASSVHSGGTWSAKIPENVLRAFFKQTKESDGSFYGALGCEQTSTPEEIKKAYKRAARVWHPDLCREENAREKFEEIKQAFDILSNPETRNKYNAGLFFERLARMAPKQTKHASFVPMFRCGNLRVKAKSELGILIIEEILDWQDILNERNQTMISFWSYGDNTFSVMWV